MCKGLFLFFMPLICNFKAVSYHSYCSSVFSLQKENLELVLSHGLQCVVKGKLNEAEIIFSQALFLPDFQRVAIKSFLYICLAVIANKRIKQG